MKNTSRKYPKRRRNLNATTTPTTTKTNVGKVDKNTRNSGKCVSDYSNGNGKVVNKKVTIIQKIGDNMNPSVRLVDIEAVKLYQRKGNGVNNSQTNQQTRNHCARTTKNAKNNSTVKTTAKKGTVTATQVFKDKSLINLQPVVRLVDCYESLFSLSATIASASSSSASNPPPPPVPFQSPSKNQQKVKRRGRPLRKRKAAKVKPPPPILQELKSRGLQEFKLSDLIKKSAQNSKH